MNNFQNMGGMGRPTPNNMQQMGQQHMQQAPQLTPQTAQSFIVKAMQSQGPFAGWQAQMPLEQRVLQVRQLIDSLRLIRPAVEYGNAVSVAMTFEQKAFSTSGSRDQYIAACREKLSKIHDQRTQQASQGMMNGQFANNDHQIVQQMGQNMMFPQHAQQQMQANSMRNQQGMQQGMFVTNQNMQNNMGLQAGMIPQNAQHGLNAQGTVKLTEDENKVVNTMASQMARNVNMNPQAKQQIINNFSPQQRASIQAQGHDIIHVFFRQQALKQYKNRKVQEMQSGQGQQDMSGNLGDNSQYQAQLNTMLNQAMNNPAQSMGNLSRFQGQQADGLRSQETGELVVPASSGQGMTPEQFRMQQVMMQNQANQQRGQNANSQMLARQQQLQAGQQMTPDQLQTLAQFQNQSQAQAQARNQAAMRAQQMGLQPQATVMGANPSANPVQMPNRPLSQNMNIPSTSPRPSSRTPMLVQQQTPNQMPAQPVGLDQQKREAVLSQYPAVLANQLRHKPTSEWKSTIAQFHASDNMRRSISQQPPGAQQTPQMGQINQPVNGQGLTASAMGATPMQASLSAGAQLGQGQTPSQQVAQQQLAQQHHQRQLQQNQEMMRQRQVQMQQQQQQHQNLQNGSQQPTSAGRVNQPLIQMTPEQINAMDRQAFPPGIEQLLNKIPNFPSSRFRVWGEIKQWLAQNPQPNIPPHILVNFQQRHYTNAMKQRQAGMNVAGNQQGMPLGQQSQVIGSSQMQATPGNAMQNRQSQMPANIPVMFSDNDLRRARTVEPRLVSMPDAQLRAFLTQQRQEQARKKLQQGQQNNQMQGFPNQPSQLGFMQQPGQVQSQNQLQITQQASAQGMPPAPITAPGQPTQMAQVSSNRPQPTKMQPQQPSGPSQMVKGVKRANDDDIVEVPNPSQPQLPVPRAIPDLTPEQVEKLNPQQKQGYAMMMKRKQQQSAAWGRITELTKQVQLTMPALRPMKNMDAKSKERIQRLLTSADTKNMLNKFDQFILAFSSIEPRVNEEEIKNLLLQRMHLIPQYVPDSYKNKTFEPVRDFSVSADYVEKAIREMFAKFQHVLQKTAGPNKQAQPQQPRVTPLTPENLTLLEAQEAQRKVQKSRVSNVPPAPTSSQPPFQIGDPRGQGTPKYAQPGLRPEDLKLPTDPKRRRKNPPAPASATPPTATLSQAQSKSPKATKERVAENVLKCPVPTCDFHMKGFASQTELLAHAASVHKPDLGHIADPVAFLEEATAKALDLDQTGQPNKKLDVAMKAPAMQKTMSKASIGGSAPGVKQEEDGKPATPAAMARGPSQTDAKTSPMVSKAAKTEPDIDAWSTTNIPLHTLRDTFGGIDMGEVVPSIGRGVGDGEGIGLDLEAMMDEYMQSDAWTKIQGPSAGDVLSEEDTEKSHSVSPPTKNEVLEQTAVREPEPKSDLNEKEQSDLLVSLRGFDGIDLSIGLLDVPGTGKDASGDVPMADSWELPELGGFDSSSGLADRKDSDTDSWDDWLKMDLGDVSTTFDTVDGMQLGNSPFEEVDWDALLKDEDGLKDLQAGAGPMAQGILRNSKK